jgi:hypothetical protein
MGLLLPHKRKLLIHKDMISLSIPTENQAVGGGDRSEIETFSRESRYRLLRCLHTLTFHHMTFITLTYPREFPTDSRIYKAHLKEYRRRFEERYGKIPGVWRLEFQKRGAPHYHILYLDAPFIPVREWSALWADVTHSKSENHRKNGVDLKLIVPGSESKLIAFYVAKYVGKVDETTAKNQQRKPGRWWGKWNVEEVQPIEVEIDLNEAIALVDEILSDRQSHGWEPIKKDSCTIFGENLGTGEFEKQVVARVKEIVDRKTARKTIRNITGTCIYNNELL